MNPWTNPDGVPAQDAEQMAAFLQARAQTPDQRRLYAAVVEGLAPQPGEHVLDLGCGIGILTVHLATQVEPEGLVYGVDLGATMIAAAQRLSPHPAARYEQGDAQSLTFPDHRFDAATAVRLLLHVPQPTLVLRELCRVVRPGGRIALLEWDWGTLALDHSQRPLTRRILDWRCDAVGGDNWMGRQLPRLCHAAGWRVRSLQPLVSVAYDALPALVGSLRRAADGARQQQIISCAEHTGWLGEIEQRLADGTFFASINDYLVIAE